MKLISSASIISFLFVIAFNLFASSGSDYYMPKEYKNAYKNQTRSYDGKPGPNYWQNFSEYDIKAEIVPSSKMLKGSQKVVYYNNSPDTLKSIVFKIYQNMNKLGAARNSELTKESITDGVRIEKIIVNDKNISLNPDDKQINIQGTNLIIKLNNPLSPNSSENFEIDWSFTIPSGENPRMGAYGESTFFIAYWYPKIAVYDDIYKWDVLNYNGEHEFYNDYSNMKVEIKVPAGFAVWATGELTNPEYVMSSKIYDRYVNSLTSDEVINIVTSEDIGKNIYNSENGFTTWKYKADYIPDFAFGVSDKYLWDGTSIQLEPGKRVSCFAAYNPESEFFTQAAGIARRSIEFFSNTMPGIVYPYPQITVFNGEGGMEFPMIVNDGDFKNLVNDVYVTTHEIAHMYFPFYVGTNETRFSWIDEGMAYFLPWDLQIEFSDYDHRTRAAVGYSNWANNEFDFPLMIPSYASRNPHLGLMSYYKPALAFEIIQNALGEEMFSQALKEFINRWNGEHPTPYDFFYTLENVSGRSLEWLVNPWFFERGVPDLAIKDVKVENNKMKILVEKTGVLPTPVDITIYLDNDSKLNLSETVNIWEDGKDSFWLEAEISSKPVSVELANKNIPDSNLLNNKFEIN
jgi:hypothetical protein